MTVKNTVFYLFAVGAITMVVLLPNFCSSSAVNYQSASYSSMPD